MRRARWKRKNVSAGRSAPAQTSCRRRGMVGGPLRQSGTETPGPWGNLWPGEVWDTLSLPPRCRSLALHGTRQRVAKWNARKEELVKCVLAPRRGLHHPPRDGSIDLAEDCSVPEGQAKPKQAPIRRPPSRGGPLHRSAPKAIFSLTPGAAHSLFVKNKKRMGGAPPWEQPLAGADTPEAAVRRPASLPRGVPPNRGALPLYFSSNTDTYTVPLTSNPSLAFT